MELILMGIGSGLLGVGVVVLGGSTYMEIKFKEPVYKVAIKVGGAILGLGGTIFTAACAMGVLS